MATITHQYVSTAPAVSGKVDSTAWNDTHNVSDIANADISASAGIVESKLSLNYPTHAAVTIDTANGLSILGQVLSLQLASAIQAGALSAADWSTFSAKQAALTWQEATVDFGTSPVYNKSFTVTDATCTPTSKVFISPQAVGDEAEFDAVYYAAKAGSGSFTVYSSALPGPVMGTRKFNYFIGV